MTSKHVPSTGPVSKCRRSFAFLLFLLFLALLGAGVRSVGRAADLPRPGTLDGLGVNIHFTEAKQGELEMLKAAGFRWVRMDFDWISTEPSPGRYDFRAYDRLVAGLEKQGLKAIFILDYVHPAYDNAQSPHTPEGRRAMARWAGEAARHFAEKPVVWEMYNEPNITPFWRPNVNAGDYLKLALEVGRAVREADPNAVYVGPATSGIDFPFLETCFKGGLLNLWDAVTVHPYRQQDPESVIPDYRRLRSLIERYAPRGKRIPILSGEWGYSSVWRGMDSEKQAVMLTRQWLTNLSQDVAISIWYDWRDDGPDPREPEHHFGTVEHPYREGLSPVYAPKPAYRAASALARLLESARHAMRLSLSIEEHHAHLFVAGDKPRLACWTVSGAPAKIRIPASPGTFQVFSHLGERLPDARADKKGLEIVLKREPVYLIPNGENALLRIAANWERAPLEVRAEAQPSLGVPLSLRNPLGRPIRVKTTSAERLLAPGASYPFVWRTPVTRSDQSQELETTIEIADLGKLAQIVPVVASNPLRVTAASAGSSVLRLLAENPSGEPFTGRVHAMLIVSGERRDVQGTFQLATGQTEAAFDLPLGAPLGPAYRVGLWVKDEHGRQVLRVPTDTVRRVDDFAEQNGRLVWYVVTADGDAKVDSAQSIARAEPSGGPPVPGLDCLRLLYRFDPGWKFAEIKPERTDLLAIEGKPKAVGMWIWGDGQGNIPRLRFRDSSGQTFQPDGPPMVWRGWKYIVLPMDGSKAGHWGGAGDGIVRYPIKWQTLFLLDSASRSLTRGEVYIAGPSLLY